MKLQAKRGVLLTLAICIMFTLGATRLDIFGAGNSNIVFYKSRKPTKKIALSFDDGPHPRYTERILEILDQYSIKATFFAIGVNIQNYPEPLRKVAAAGHEIGNHSFSHSVCNPNKVYNLAEEMQKCDSLIFETTGQKPKLFRPPCGIYDDKIINAAEELGYSVVLWSVDTLDWKGTEPCEIANTVEREIDGGEIILMHDYTSGKNTTCAALELIIPQLLAKGYEFVKVSELLQES